MFAICVALLVTTSRAHAEDASLAKPNDVQAREHLAEGNKHYRVREFEQAATEYKEGARIESAPVFDYNLGQCYRLLGKYEDALWHYDRFLKHGHPSGPLLDAVNSFIAQMRAELDRKAMTQKPTDAAPQEGAAAGHDAAPAQTSSQAAVPAPTTLVVVDRSEPWYDDKLGWGLAGAGAISIGVAGYLFWDASSLRDQANSSPDQTRRHDLQSQASTRNVIGVVVGIGGLGLLATGIVKLAIHPDGEANHQASSWVFGVTGNGVMAFGRF